jgi:DNA-binding FadR family transcriptional regulator
MHVASLVQVMRRDLRELKQFTRPRHGSAEGYSDQHRMIARVITDGGTDVPEQTMAAHLDAIEAKLLEPCDD